MADKSLSYFMRDLSKEKEIVEIPGVESIKDEKGNIIPFKVRILSNKEIMEIYDKYKTKKIAYDKKGRPILSNGQVAFIVENDTNRALRRIIVEALEYPDLKNKELMDYYKCPSYDDMPYMVFPNSKEYIEVQNNVMIALGMSQPEDEEIEDDIEEAKN